MKRVSVSGGSLWSKWILPLVTYRNVKIFLSGLLVTSLVFLMYVLATEAGGPKLDKSRGMALVPDGGVELGALLGTDTSNPHLHYGVVVDCGSSGSRVYVYYWPPHDGNPSELLNIQQMKDSNGQPIVMKVEPGLSEFAPRPSEASDYLSPLLDLAAEHIPAVKHKETPLYIMATAGLRMLPYSAQEEILADLRVDIALSYDFLFTDTQVEVISGKQEGIYAWISINYALHKFDHINGDDAMVQVPSSGSESEDGPRHMRKRTVGMIDMGGGSLQIAYEVSKSEDVPKAQLAEFNLGCTDGDAEHTYRVYVATFLGYGGNVARTRYDLLLASNYSAHTARTQLNNNSSQLSYTESQSVINDPCLPVGMRDTISVSSKQFLLRGTGNFDACARAQVALLNQTVACTHAPCSLNGMHHPPIDMSDSEFYGFSEFYYSMEDVLRMAGKYNLKTFQHAAQEFCGTDWSQLQEWYNEGFYPKANPHRFKMQCFKSAWIATVFHNGFHFPQQYKHLTSTQLVRDQDVGWTLGALVYKTRYFPLREIEKYRHQRAQPAWAVDSQHSYYLVSCCLVIVLAAILLYIRRLRSTVRGSRSDRGGHMDRVPTMSYFMTDEAQVEEGIQRERHDMPYYYSYSTTS